MLCTIHVCTVILVDVYYEVCITDTHFFFAKWGKSVILLDKYITESD